MHPKNGVVLQEENGEGILFDPLTLLTAWLNDSAILVWKSLEEGKTPEEIALRLSDSFEGLSRENAIQDVTETLESLRLSGFLES